MQYNGPVFTYGDLNFSTLLQNPDSVNTLATPLIERTVEQLLKFGDLTDTHKDLIRGINFRFENSHRISARVVNEGLKNTIYFPKGLVGFLGLLNCVVASYHGAVLSKVEKTKNGLSNEKQKEYCQYIFDIYNYFFDHHKHYPHFQVNIPVVPHGLFSMFKKDSIDNIEVSPLLRFIDHQLEFITLHEIAHVLYPDVENRGEKIEDDFAIRQASLIWKGNSWHSSVCEFFQIVLFIYYDFYQIYQVVREHQIMWWNNKDKNFFKFRHIFPDLEHFRTRFFHMLGNRPVISENAKMLFQQADYLFSRMIDFLLFTELDMVHFFNVTNIEIQIRRKSFIDNYAVIEFDASSAENIKRMVNSKLYTTDNIFSAKKHLSPFSRYFLGLKTDPPEVLMENDKRIALYNGAISRQFLKKFPINQKKIGQELKRFLRLK